MRTSQPGEDRLTFKYSVNEEPPSHNVALDRSYLGCLEAGLLNIEVADLSMQFASGQVSAPCSQSAPLQPSQRPSEPSQRLLELGSAPLGAKVSASWRAKTKRLLWPSQRLLEQVSP